MFDLDKSPATGIGDKEAAKHECNTLQPTRSVDGSQIEGVQDNRNGQFHRSFSPRQVHVRLIDSTQCLSVGRTNYILDYFPWIKHR